MAMVYLARDPAFERQVAIKVIPPQYTQDPQFRARFEREAKVIAALEHPYIVPVYDYGEEGDQPYIVMRFMPGGTLADRIYGKPMPLTQVIPILQRLADAVDAAHRNNIIHCDLKPSNVLFDVDGRAFLSDFGIARLLETSSAAIPGALGLIGTPAYMSPEQCAGETNLDGRSDVYSLGLILYEMLNGNHPFGDSSDATEAMLRKQVSEPPPPLDLERLGLPDEVNAVLAWALAKQPEARYPTAGALARALSALWDAPGTPTPSKPLIPIVPSSKPQIPTPPAENNTTQVLEPTRPILPSVLRSWKVGVPVLLGLVGLFLFLIFSTSSLIGRPTPTATATTTAAATLGPTRTEIGEGVFATTTPTATESPTATRQLTATRTRTATATPSPTASATATRRPPTRTATLTATVACPPGEFYDPFLNRCRPPDPTDTPSPVPPEPP
jgi:serine/threonine-protein kinase